jgi:hypothetical protein
MRARLLLCACLAGCGTEPSVALIATPDSVLFAGFGGTPSPATLQLSSPGDTVAWAAESDAPWLAIFPSSGSITPALLTMTANAAGLGGGTHRGTMRLSAAGGALDVPVRLDVPRMAGTWIGTVPGNIGLELVLTDSAGVIAGTGAFIGSTGTRLPLVVAGTHGHPSVIFTLNAQPFTPATVSGAFVGERSVAATLTGSGYMGEVLILTRP